jgi:hypothetical protein
MFSDAAVLYSGDRDVPAQLAMPALPYPDTPPCVTILAVSGQAASTGLPSQLPVPPLPYPDKPPVVTLAISGQAVSRALPSELPVPAMSSADEPQSITTIAVSGQAVSTGLPTELPMPAILSADKPSCGTSDQGINGRQALTDAERMLARAHRETMGTGPVALANVPRRVQKVQLPPVISAPPSFFHSFLARAAQL